MDKTRVVVTGASGFVGSALVRVLSQRSEIEIQAGVRDVTVTIPGVDNVVVLDLTKHDTLYFELQKLEPDIIINAAAYGVVPEERDSERALAVNLAGALALLAAASQSGCQRFVQLGSCSEYGDREGVVKEIDLPMPTGIYGSSKAAATILLQERGSSLGINVLVARLFNMWGENEPSHRVFPAIVSACQEGKPLSLTDGTQSKDFSYVGDVAEWLVALSLLPDFPVAAVANVASGNSMPLREFVMRIAEWLGRPDLMRFGELSNRGDESRNQIPDLATLDSLLPDRTLTRLEDALDRVLR